MESATNLTPSNGSRGPIFNGKYEIIKSLGEGHSSKVYQGVSLTDPAQKVAIKILKENFLAAGRDNIKSV